MPLTATPKRIYQGVIDNTVGQQQHFTVTDQCIVIKDIELCNLDSAAITKLSMWIVPSGEIIADKHYIFKNLPFMKSEFIPFDTSRIVLEYGDSVYFESSDSIVSCYLSGGVFSDI